MRVLTITAFALIAILFAPSQTWGQSNRTLEQLSQLNRINPLQNPEYEQGRKVINRKIIDRKNKVVGRVEDIIVNQNGTIASIKTDLDRLRLGSSVHLNYRNMRIRTVSNAYALNMDSDEIADFYPQLLADIETASGADNDSFSMKKIIGASLRAKDGRRLGKVENVLLGSNGAVVRAVYAKLAYGTQRGDTIAVPFRNVAFTSKNGRLSGTIENDVADAILKIADD